MKTLHISAECFPAAKAGGLGDVVGALPKYLIRAGMPAAVVLPKYDIPWIRSRRTEVVFSGAFKMANGYDYPFSVEQIGMHEIEFPLYVVHIPGQFDREGIYGDAGGWFGDNAERFIFFQQAVLYWILHVDDKPDILHCHDHHSGLIPFMVRHCPEYYALRNIPTVFTIHNGAYHGGMSWDKHHLLPAFHPESGGLLEWDHSINPLASAIKCAWKVTTVSNAYLEELATFSNGLESLVRSEWTKCSGIINGIDAQVWDPATDPYLHTHFHGDVPAFKIASKQALLQRFHFDPSLPTITFIGRLVREKGADLLPGLIQQVLSSGLEVNFLVLGTGEPELHYALGMLKPAFPGRLDVQLAYDEGLAHQLYAGADFLLMPSRVEPCGLNQMYAMRYGNIPIVRSTGGLKDTVSDIATSPATGRGIRFDQLDVHDAHHAIWRACEVYRQSDLIGQMRERLMQIDFSWENAAHNYICLYLEII
jgi:starch synthase